MTATFLMVLLVIVWGFISLAMLVCLMLMVVSPPRVWVPVLLVLVLSMVAVIQSSEASFSIVFNQEVQP